LIVIEAPILADCVGPLLVTAAAAGAAGGAVVIGVGAGLPIGSPCGRVLVGSSFFLFHTWGSLLFLHCLVRHLSHLEGQLLIVERSRVCIRNTRNFYVLFFSYRAHL
jgi:hypothetical protein